MTTPLPVPAKFQALVNGAIASWAPGSDLTVRKDLVGGRSTASVLLVDIVADRSRTSGGEDPATISGEFILKLDEPRAWEKPEAGERERHEAASQRNTIFASKHIPRLLRYVERDDATALLYEIAGHSLAGLVTADAIDAGALELRCRQLAAALLADWNQDYTIDPKLSAGQMLADWLGYRLDADKAPSLHEYLAQQTGARPTFLVAGHLLVNPLWLCTAPFIEGDTRHARFAGFLHGDLHPGNLLFERQDPRSKRFWLIDFALSNPGPLCYDHAYFELALLVHFLEGADPERLLGILAALEAPDGQPEASSVPVHDMGLLQCLRGMRTTAGEWQKQVEPNRHDPFWAQQLLARVAVSLNWTNKPLNPTQRRLALTYGAWAGRKYVSTFHEATWHELVSAASVVTQGSSSSEGTGSVSSPNNQAMWTEAWMAAGRFDATTAKFVLLTGRMGSDPDFASLGLLPWSAIIDMDPLSGESGLFSVASPVLEKLRSLKQFGKQPLEVDFERGTAWLMAAGWPSRHEPVLPTLRDWRRVYLSRIRDLCANIRRAVSPQVVRVLALPGERLAGELLARTIEAIDEGLGDLAHVIVVGPDVPSDNSLVKAYFPLTPASFVAGVRSMYGTREDVRDPEIPGADGPVSIPVDRLRNLEEDLDILHSNILTEEALRLHDQESFWRGTPPTWADLHANADIEREVHNPLIDVLEKSLKQSRNHTVELRHSPGAGGTTVALRAAWTLRERHPTAILRSNSKLALDRIDQLFQLSQRPVLLVADASVLTSSAREDLYRGLAARNSRVVILYVVRTTHADKERPLGVFDPMSEDEALAFGALYSKRTTSAYRLQRLKQISSSPSPSWERYRSPFFFGLITFERDFESVDRYVEAHVRDIGYRPRQLMLYLALVTRYSQIGIDEALLLSLLGLDPTATLNLEEAIGSGPARLVLRTGRQRKLLHPLIAEEVIRKLLGGHVGDGWKDGLKDLAIDLIQDVVRILGSDATETSRLFIQLFISRDSWSDQRVKARPRFAELISAIPSVAGQHQVLTLLTEVCPQDAHYWNHLGRHHFYEMKQDFSEAERYLEKAVELSPDDAYHRHSLGMVRRFWIEHRLDDVFKESSTPEPLSVLEAVRDLASRAAESFAKARELNPEDQYGYITHIQMVLFITERLVRASGDAGLVGLSTPTGVVSDWLRSNLVAAEDLLSKVQHMRGQAEPSRYELKCVSGLTDLYGDFEEVIRAWEGMLKDSTGQGDLRRALASAYHARRGRVWSGLSDVELRRIVDLMESNLREDPTSDRDLRMWFQSYRRLPEFSYLQALDRLGAWATRSNSLDAHFYLYILHYLRFRDGVERNEELVVASLAKCRALAEGRRGHSYEWLGLEPSWCPLVHHHDLGEWDKTGGFYPDTQKLAEVSGTIETIKGPQAGTIRLGEAVRAFFVPGTHQWGSKDINAVVHFYLGFSYDGFRAWTVRPGPASTTIRGARSAGAEFVASAHDAGAGGEKSASAATSFAPRPGVGSFAAGAAPSRLQPKRPAPSQARLAASAAAPEPAPSSTPIPARAPAIAPPRAPATGPARPATPARAPAIAPASSATGGSGGGRDAILTDVRAIILELLATAERARRQLYVSQLGAALATAFPGEPVYQRLGFRRLIDLLRSLDGIGVEGEATKDVVCRRPMRGHRR